MAKLIYGVLPYTSLLGGFPISDKGEEKFFIVTDESNVDGNIVKCDADNPGALFFVEQQAIEYLDLLNTPDLQQCEIRERILAEHQNITNNLIDWFEDGVINPKVMERLQDSHDALWDAYQLQNEMIVGESQTNTNETADGITNCPWCDEVVGALPETTKNCPACSKPLQSKVAGDIVELSEFFCADGDRWRVVGHHGGHVLVVCTESISGYEKGHQMVFLKTTLVYPI